MIRYTLKCPQDHRFESWFASSDAFDKLARAGQISCPECGSPEISKSLMAPSVSPEAKAPLSTPKDTPLAKLREKIERDSENVGLRFAKEARAMHEGEIPERQIHGEAKPEEAKALLEDGVPILPLPFIPKSKAN